MRSLALALALASTAALAGEGDCHSDMECAPWQQCTVTLGECGGGDTPLDVCTGGCEAGRSWRFVARASGGWFEELRPTSATALLEAEAVAPVLWGIPSFTLGVLPIQRGVRAGFGLSAGYQGVRAGLHLSGLLAYVGDPVPVEPTESGRRLWDRAPLLSARLELFPWAAWDFVTPFHHLSLTIEAGAGLMQVGDVVRPVRLLTAGVGWWI